MVVYPNSDPPGQTLIPMPTRPLPWEDPGIHRAKGCDKLSQAHRVNLSPASTPARSEGFRLQAACTPGLAASTTKRASLRIALSASRASSSVRSSHCTVCGFSTKRM
jgi:hypothetical protein